MHGEKMMFVKAAVTRLSNVRCPALYVVVAALICSVLFCFVFYPRMADPYHLELDPDRHGNLGYGIWKYHSLSYYPDREPTVERGPLYPLFIAFLLVITGDWWPYCVQLGQCVLFALMCLTVYWVSKTLWGKQVGLIIAGISVIHPLLLWYTSRMWIETMATFLLTAMIASTLCFSLRPSVWRGVLVGVVLGLGALCKSTFLPYALVIPVLLYFMPRKKTGIGPAAAIFLVAILVVVPWTVRNWKLTGKFIPVHGRVGFNLQVGDDLVEHLSTSLSSLPDLWALSMKQMEPIKSSMPKELKRHEKEILLDSILQEQCLSRYREHPGFLLKKVLVNSWLFWCLGEGPKKTLVLGALLMPLACLLVVSLILIWRRGHMRTIQGVHIFVAFMYYVMHLPVEAIARYSMVLVPTMLMYGLGPLLERLVRDDKYGT